MSESRQHSSPGVAYDAVKKDIDARFPPGRFVAIESGRSPSRGSRIIADAATHRELVQQLEAIGKSPKNLLVLQAGVQYPESATILLNRSARGCDG